MSGEKKSSNNTPIYKKWWFWVIVAVVVLAIGGGVASESNRETVEVNGTTVSKDTVQDALDKIEAATSGNETIGNGDATDTTSNATKEQRNALKKAESYAKNMHMSKMAVYNQLTSEYGEGFAAEDAQYAIDHLEGIDWNANALAKAKSYYENMNMSKSKVYDQLVSEYGEKFTADEAQYAVDHLE